MSEPTSGGRSERTPARPLPTGYLLNEARKARPKTKFWLFLAVASAIAGGIAVLFLRYL